MQGKNVIDCAPAASVWTFVPVNIRLYITVFLYPATQKVAGYYVIPSGPFECPFVRPSELRFRTLTWVVFDRFFKLYMDIDIREEWFWDCNGVFLFWSSLNSVMALHRRQNFLCSISCELICGFRSNFVCGLILTNCRLGMIEQYVSFILTELCPLVDIDILFMLNILLTNWWILIKFCKCIDIDKM